MAQLQGVRSESPPGGVECNELLRSRAHEEHLGVFFGAVSLEPRKAGLLGECWL